MSRNGWHVWILAAMVVALCGVALAMAETVKVKVERTGEELTLDINGAAQVIHLEDLAEGEERTYEAGDHTFVVRRAGDELELLMDGGELHSGHFGGHSLENMVWVTDDGECEIDVEEEGGVRKVIVMRGHGDADDDEGAHVFCLRGEHGEDMLIDIDEIKRRLEAGELEGLEEIDVDVSVTPHVVVLKPDDAGPHPIVIKRHGIGGGEVVRYRCEDTGSELIVNKDDAIEDAYIDPATGCLMERVEEPNVHVIKIEKRVKQEGDEELQ